MPEPGEEGPAEDVVIPESAVPAEARAPEQQPARPFSAGQIIVLALLGGSAPFAIDVYLASIPHVAVELKTTAATVQLTLTGFMVGMAVGPLLMGPASDRYGRYRLLLGGLVALLASSILCAMAPSIGVLIAMRVLQGLSASTAMTVSRALVADVVTGIAAARIYSMLSTIMGVAPIIAPIVGGLIQQWANWRVAFWFVVVIAVLLLVGTLAALRETLPPERRHSGGLTSTFKAAGRVLRDRRFVAYTLAGSFAGGCIFSYISASPFVLQDIMGFSPLKFSVIFAINAVGLMSSAAISTATVVRVGPARLVRIGVAVLLTGALVVAAAAAIGATSPWILLPAMFLVPFGAGFVFGNSTALALENVTWAAGTAQAISGFLQFGMSGIVAPLVSLAGPHSIVPLGVLLLACSLLAVGATAVGGRAARSELA